MRIERQGGLPDLQVTFSSFVLSALKGRALDDNKDEEARKGKFPDFSCFRGLLLIEMKHLEADQHDRVNEVFEKLVDPIEKPVFYGTRDGKHIIDNVSNGEQVKAMLASKLSRTIETHLSKANKQFADYRARHPRKNSVAICVILNSGLQEFTPDLVLRAVHGKMKGKADQATRFPYIDGVLYISEKHYTMLPDGRMAFPVGIFEAAIAEQEPWKASVIDHVVNTWSRRRSGGPMASGDLNVPFDVIDDIPKSMPRHDHWRLEYKRRPYLRKTSDDRLKIIFNRCIAMSSLTLLKGSWPKPPKEHTMQQMRFFTHIIEETNHRGVDLRKFNPRSLSAEERREAYRGLPQGLVDLLAPKPSPDDKAA